jgi:hypothetical protein
MSVGDCDICGQWDGALVEGVCLECTNRYSNNVDAARDAFEVEIEKPDGSLIKLQRIAKLAGVCMTCTFDDE